MSRSSASFSVWARRIHYALGLYLLLFIWLFSLSGLLLNHEWEFDEFWENRVETTAERPIEVPRQRDDVSAAEHLMGQLDMRGELQKTERSADGSLLKFDLNRPGESFKVEADLRARRASITHTKMNGWGVFRNLHSFTGSKYDQPERRRDWMITTLWVAAMLATAVGLVAMVLTSLYLWWRLAAKRTWGAAMLGAGTFATGFFIWGLRLFL